ncbi:MAG: amino acid ABC transporter ATP-binding protein [Puniceicoccales bacterium]|jgi:ABC-type polar amino acid transport system ATPase subunit|nr:amino acid ABC transporter ATP-binding protein [Puniceicoccales bacterium]
MLEVKNLHCEFGENRVLDGLSFTVASGEIAAIIGGSGAGKTTIIRVLCGLEKMSGGEVNIDGVAAKLGAYGLVPQGCCLFEHMTVLGNVSYALVAVKRLGVKESERVAREMLAKFGLLDKVSAYPSSLSGGQKQRVAIARTLIMDPKILLFDEPTSALDPEMTSDVIGMIRDIAARGISILIVTHDLVMARRVSDKILFLERGRIVEDRATEDFFLNPRSERARSFLKNASCFNGIP